MSTHQHPSWVWYSLPVPYASCPGKEAIKRVSVYCISQCILTTMSTVLVRSKWQDYLMSPLSRIVLALFVHSTPSWTTTSLSFSASTVRCAEYKFNESEKMTKAQTQQGNRRLHFTRAVHSHHPLPGRSHFQRTQQRQNDPLCCIMLLTIKWTLLQQTCYSALSMGNKTPSRP